MAHYYGGRCSSKISCLRIKFRERQNSVLAKVYSLLTYKERLIKLNLLPLMYHLELADIMFYIKQNSKTHQLQATPDSSDNHRFNHTIDDTVDLLTYNCLPRLWNSLPLIDMNLVTSTIKATLKNLLWQHFLSNFDSDAPCTFHFKCPFNKCCNIHTLLLLF